MLMTHTESEQRKDCAVVCDAELFEEIASEGFFNMFDIFNKGFMVEIQSTKTPVNPINHNPPQFKVNYYLHSRDSQNKAATCLQGGRTRLYSSRWRSRTRQSFGVGSPWTSQGRVSIPGRKGWRSWRSWSITRRHARLTALSRAARGLGGVRENRPTERDDCCCCRLSVDFLHQTHGGQCISIKLVFTSLLPSLSQEHKLDSTTSN